MVTISGQISAANGKMSGVLVNKSGDLAGQLFRNLGSWRDEDVDKFIALLEPQLNGITRTASRVQASFFQAVAQSQGQTYKKTEITPADLTTEALRNGVSTKQVFERAFVDLRTALSKGKSMDEAIEAGARRATSLGKTQVQLARTHSNRIIRNNQDNIVGFARTLTGQENCALCYTASTQRYRKGDLLPIHPGCDCGEMPIFGNQDPGQVINQARLDTIDEALARDIETRFADRATLRNIIVEEHGEMGPVLTVRGQNFTDQNNLVFTNTKNYSSISNMVDDAENLQQQIDATYDYKKGRDGNGNVQMQVLVEQSGKGRKPETVETRADLPEGTVYYRGASIENIDGFINNERHRIGLGVYGDGYYFASRESVADGYATMGDTPGKTMAAVLKPDAKIFKWDGTATDIASGDGIAQIQESAAEALNYYVGNKLPSEAEEIIAENYFSNYQDAFTTDLILQGYDGMEIAEPGALGSGKGGGTYLVLFNREAVVVANQ